MAFSYDLNINDDTCLKTSPCGSTKKSPPNLNDINGLSWTIALYNGDKVSLLFLR